ncbi:hypothetical protein H257_05136 [Aphanomyces astaci]|uniref:Tc1-like transposase DDE domain-containing protein n=1 Tax=Aphanomyces astaci TaxID=112090 RepID=W4GUE7_APHAT|nr:hypothetical protein H257_05136 [Aphanomyces astaci]ETV82533.1 hypothetical protein H257_05136 [Aphanomyces astaci]|eukprot:XP_009828202.1 hypothetical protein H257_05136 [Aphanomyces astaci]
MGKSKSDVARPRYDDATGIWRDGKIGTWQFVESVQAKHDSANRAAGTYETKALTVTKDVYRAFLIDKVLPTIVSKWPCPNRLMHLQHDNARAHVTPDDAKILAAFSSYSTTGWMFSIKPQPPNSPDMNILNLGFFVASQSLQHHRSAHKVDEFQLVANVHAAFDTYPFERLDRTFITLQACREDEVLWRQRLQGASPVQGQTSAVGTAA